MKKIAIDMDGVLADVFKQFTRYHEADTGEKITVIDALGKDEQEPFEKAGEYLLTPGFFRTLPVINDSQRVMEQLNNRYEVFIVSAAMEFPQSLAEKQAWLNEHFPFITWQQMVFCGSKSIISADYMIDDHFRNLDGFQGSTILFNQPHNQMSDAGRHIRVFSWNDVEELLLKNNMLKSIRA